MAQDAIKPIARNRKAFHNFMIFDKWEAGIELKGTEVKSLRNGQVQMSDSYARIEDGEAYLIGLHMTFSLGSVWGPPYSILDLHVALGSRAQFSRPYSARPSGVVWAGCDRWDTWDTWELCGTREWGHRWALVASRVRRRVARGRWGRYDAGPAGVEGRSARGHRRRPWRESA